MIEFKMKASKYGSEFFADLYPVQPLYHKELGDYLGYISLTAETCEQMFSSDILDQVEDGHTVIVMLSRKFALA